MKLMILCWATLIAVLGRMSPAGHGLNSPDLGITMDNFIKPKASRYLTLLNRYCIINKKSL